MSQKLREPAREFQLCPRKVIDTGFEVLSVRIHGADNEFIAKHKIQVDLIRGDGMLTVATGYAGQTSTPFFPKLSIASKTTGE